MFGLPLADFVGFFVALAAAASVTGPLAGLFGVGGGAVIVPVLYQVYTSLGVPNSERTHLCVGSSLAIITPTFIQSYRTHRAKGRCGWMSSNCGRSRPWWGSCSAACSRRSLPGFCSNSFSC